MLRAQLDAETWHRQTDDRHITEAALTLLHDLPTLLREAPAPERRAILAQCIERVTLERRTVVAIHAKPLIAPALIAANERLSDADWRRMCAEWAGWASNPNGTHIYPCTGCAPPHRATRCLKRPTFVPPTGAAFSFALDIRSIRGILSVFHKAMREGVIS
jgi:hypothetical protein